VSKASSKQPDPRAASTRRVTQLAKAKQAAGTVKKQTAGLNAPTFKASQRKSSGRDDVSGNDTKAEMVRIKEGKHQKATSKGSTLKDHPKLKDTNRDGIKLKDAKSRDSKAKESKLKESKLKESKLKESKPKNSKLKESKPKTSKLKDSKPKNSKLKESKPKTSKLKDSKPKNSKLKTANLQLAKTTVPNAHPKNTDGKRTKLKAAITTPTLPASSSQSTPADAAWSAATIPSLPHMEPEGIALLGEHLTGVRVFLEYGAGGSSVMVAHAGVKSIYSVDTDKPFLKAVRQRLTDDGIPRRRFIPIYADIGATKEWGRPVDESHAREWPNYCSAPWKKLLKTGERPDLVLIDGRFRVASFLITMLMAPSGCVILFDDYANWPEYHVVERYLRPARFAGRMAEFVVEPVANPYAALIDLLQYSTESR